VALCQARISTKPLWGFSSSNPYHSQSRAEQQSIIDINLKYWVGIWCWTLFYTESRTLSCINHNIQVENLEIIIQCCTITWPVALTCYFKAGTGCLAPFVHVHCPVKWLYTILPLAYPRRCMSSTHW
jgi:hypothetical protein